MGYVSIGFEYCSYDFSLFVLLDLGLLDAACSLGNGSAVDSSSIIHLKGHILYCISVLGQMCMDLLKQLSIVICHQIIVIVTRPNWSSENERGSVVGDDMRCNSSGTSLETTIRNVFEAHTSDVAGGQLLCIAYVPRDVVVTTISRGLGWATGVRGERLGGLIAGHDFHAIDRGHRRANKQMYRPESKGEAKPEMIEPVISMAMAIVLNDWCKDQMDKQGGSGTIVSGTVIIRASVSCFLPCVPERLAVLRSANHSPIKITWRETMVRGNFVTPTAFCFYSRRERRRIGQPNIELVIHRQPPQNQATTLGSVAHIPASAPKVGETSSTQEGTAFEGQFKDGQERIRRKANHLDKWTKDDSASGVFQRQEI